MFTHQFSSLGFHTAVKHAWTTIRTFNDVVNEYSDHTLRPNLKVAWLKSNAYLLLLRPYILFYNLVYKKLVLSVSEYIINQVS